MELYRLLEVANPAISVEKLEEILTWKDEKCLMDDIVTRLRQRTVPILGMISTLGTKVGGGGLHRDHCTWQCCLLVA